LLPDDTNSRRDRNKLQKGEKKKEVKKKRKFYFLLSLSLSFSLPFCCVVVEGRRTQKNVSTSILFAFLFSLMPFFFS
jgi:hypothetical protein